MAHLSEDRYVAVTDPALADLSARCGVPLWLLDPTEQTHLDGVRWMDAPTPSKWHRCWPQTIGWIGYFSKVERCACGAIRVTPAETGRRSWWQERNSRGLGALRAGGEVSQPPWRRAGDDWPEWVGFLVGVAVLLLMAFMFVIAPVLAILT